MNVLAPIRATAPAADVIADWLLRLEEAVGGNLPAEKLRGRINMILFALGDLPDYCWTDQTLILAARRFKFFPSVAELDEVLRPIKEARERPDPIRSLPPPVEESREPYPIEPAPSWCFDRNPKHLGRPGANELDVQPPVRTVEEQIAAILGSSADE